MSIILTRDRGEGRVRDFRQSTFIRRRKKMSIIFFELKFKFWNYNLSDENEVLSYQIKHYDYKTIDAYGLNLGLILLALIIRIENTFVENVNYRN